MFITVCPELLSDPDLGQIILLAEGYLITHWEYMPQITLNSKTLKDLYNFVFTHEIHDTFVI